MSGTCDATGHRNRAMHDQEPFCENWQEVGFHRRRVLAELLSDPYPVGCVVRVRDHDGVGILGPFEVVRSYWPTACVELLIDGGMVRQNHDRIIP